MSIAELSIRRPITTVMLFVSMVVIGLIAAVRLPLESMPDVSAPFIYVHLPYSGSTPEEVERTILRPAEEALSTLTDIKSMQGNATAESAGVFLMFSDWDRDTEIAAAEARERIDAIRDELPDDFQRYFVYKWSTSDEPAISLLLTSGTLDLTREYDRIERNYKRRLERIPGVAKVDVEGAPQNEVEIAIDPDRLNATGLGLNELTQRLRAINFSVSAGQISADGQRLRVQPVGELASLDQLRDLVVADGVRLADIADVRLKSERMSYGRRVDGNPSVGIDVFKERDANLVAVSRAVLDEVEAIKAERGEDGITIDVRYDQGENVTSSLLSLAEAGAIGLLLSIAVLFFFLRHWPSTLMVTLAIPICFIMTLGFMYFVGVTLNILSMMGLLLAVGMLVDNAVVVVESIYQEREKYPGKPRLASIVGTRHVAIALSAGTLCHCIVFLPMMFGEKNIITIYLSQLAITISVSLLASWLVAVSLIPMLSARMKTPPAVSSDTGLIPRLQERYARFLRWTLEHRGWAGAGILAITLLSIVPMQQVKSDSGDEEDPGEINLFYQWHGSYSKEEMGGEVARIERYIEQNRERWGVERVYSRYSEEGWARTEIDLAAKDPEVTEKLKEEIREGMPKSARANIGFGWQSGNGDEKGVQFNLLGESTEVLRQIAADITPILMRNKSLRDVRVSTGDSSSELKVRVNRERAAAFGFSAEQVAQFVGLALRGASLREFHRGDVEIPVNVRFEGAEHFGAADLESFMVRGPDGRSVPLLAMVDVDVAPAADEISRMNRQTMLKIEAGLATDATMEDARKAIEGTLATVQFPPGYGYTFEGGGFGMQMDMDKTMLRNVAIALVLIFIVMAAVFESLLFPLAIMSGVLFSVFGVYWLFWITGTAFNIMAFIGILVLMGVVVNNGIVLIEHINNLRRRGMSRTDALVTGGRERLRPILMTMGTAILAMVPIAVSSTQLAGEGPPYYPMARAIAGGLAFSTVVSLLFLPTIYALLDDLSNGTSRLIAKARQGKRKSMELATDEHG